MSLRFSPQTGWKASGKKQNPQAALLLAGYNETMSSNAEAREQLIIKECIDAGIDPEVALARTRPKPRTRPDQERAASVIGADISGNDVESKILPHERVRIPSPSTRPSAIKEAAIATDRVMLAAAVAETHRDIYIPAFGIKPRFLGTNGQISRARAHPTLRPNPVADQCKILPHPDISTTHIDDRRVTHLTPALSWRNAPPSSAYPTSATDFAVALASSTGTQAPAARPVLPPLPPSRVPVDEQGRVVWSQRRWWKETLSPPVGNVAVDGAGRPIGDDTVGSAAGTAPTAGHTRGCAAASVARNAAGTAPVEYGVPTVEALTAHTAASEASSSRRGGSAAGLDVPRSLTGSTGRGSASGVPPTGVSALAAVGASHAGSAATRSALGGSAAGRGSVGGSGRVPSDAGLTVGASVRRVSWGDSVVSPAQSGVFMEG